MDEKKFNQAEYQNDWSKKNMAFVTAKFKKEFVNEFKKGCDILKVSQSKLIKEKMQMTIDNAKSQANELFIVTKSRIEENNLIREIERNDFLTKEAAFSYYSSLTLLPRETKKFTHELNGIEQYSETYPI
ncbi:MAG: hypothetical protein RR500_05710 [Bacilli bacterium]